MQTNFVRILQQIRKLVHMINSSAFLRKIATIKNDFPYRTVNNASLISFLSESPLIFASNVILAFLYLIAHLPLKKLNVHWKTNYC